MTGDCRSPAFLQGQIAAVAGFYARHARDPAGGFHHCLNDDGSACSATGSDQVAYPPGHRHLVSATRLVYTFATAAAQSGDPRLRVLAARALSALHVDHFRESDATFRWTRNPVDETVYAYGLAFVMLAGSIAMKAGLSDGAWYIDTAGESADRLFWEADQGLYADSWTPAGLDPYRGQNANMHFCEAHLSAWEATGDGEHLTRALRIAESITNRLAAETGGLIWEHYDTDWAQDFDFNRDKPDDLFRPWGFQPGHHAEWAKLLVQLHDHTGDGALLNRARELFAVAVERGWDSEYQGLVYGFGPKGGFVSSDKYYWVQAEAIGAAALLFRATGESIYDQWYGRLWEYAARTMIDDARGGWIRILDRKNRPYDRVKSPPGKAGYHPIGACLAALTAYGER